LKALSGKDFCRLLERKGWQLKRIHGSHHIFIRPGAPLRISVPVHGAKTLKPGLQRHLMKLANILDEEL
jgi:predicted RNA binding protein YcfA (HicA-like mRNA interferase family)